MSRDQVEIVQQGVIAWNAWRLQRRADGSEPDFDKPLQGILGERSARVSRRPDLSHARLGGADLGGANFSWTVLSNANLGGANLVHADLHGADLTDADMRGADMRHANLRHANLRGALLHSTKLEGADLTGCWIYGVAVWDVSVDETTQQHDLQITHLWYQTSFTVDSLELAQFIYLLLNNNRMRHVIDTITSKLVLILGRFTPERKAVLNVIREELRRHDFVPILFDFEQPTARTLTETISLLARMSRFVIVDLTDARSVPQELGVIVPDLPSLPVLPLLHTGATEYPLFEDYSRYPWVLPRHDYESGPDLQAALANHLIASADMKATEMAPADPHRRLFSGSHTE